MSDSHPTRNNRAASSRRARGSARFRRGKVSPGVEAALCALPGLAETLIGRVNAALTRGLGVQQEVSELRKAVEELTRELRRCDLRCPLAPSRAGHSGAEIREA